MRFQLDENADRRLVAFLVALDHDVATVVDDYPNERSTVTSWSSPDSKAAS